MLVVEVAVGVLIALIAFNQIRKFNKKKELEIIENQKISLLIKNHLESIDKTVERRFITYLEVFIKRMETLKDDSTIKFQDAGMIEFNIFLEQCKELSEKINTEEKEYLNSIPMDDRRKNQIEYEIASIVSSKSNTAQRGALKIMEDKLIEIANEP
jgi:hypothetical protein